ncbi:hypothetical protein CHU98_g8037 [Xylaria longipes]|nr:hypothetical protein CHU98_g8037 [Xylaria longipes]
MLTDVFGLKRPFPMSAATSLIGESLERPRNTEDDVEECETKGVGDAAVVILKRFLSAKSPRAQPFNFTLAWFTKKDVAYYPIPKDPNSDSNSEPEKCMIKPDYKAWSIRPISRALKKETLFKEVLNLVGWNKVSTNSDLNAQEGVQRHVAMALIQVYDYMIVEGVKYGYLAAGRASVLLYVDRGGDSDDAMKTLYYHLCVPGTDVHQHGPSHTAVAQLTTFYLHSFCSEAFTHNNLDIHRKAEATLEHWPNHYNGYEEYVTPLVNSQLTKSTELEPNSQAKSEESDGSWTNESKSKGKSKAKPKAKPKSKQQPGCNLSKNPKNPHRDDDNDRNGDNNPSRTPGLPQITAGQKRKYRHSTNNQQHRSVVTERYGITPGDRGYRARAYGPHIYSDWAISAT